MVYVQSRFIKHLRFVTATAAVLLVAAVGWTDVLVYEGFATDATGSGDNYTEDVILGSYSGYTGPDKARTGFTGQWHGITTINESINASAELDSLSYTGFATGESGHASPYRSASVAGANKWIARATNYTVDVNGYYLAALVDFNGYTGGFGFGIEGDRENLIESDGTNITFQSAGSSGQSYSTALTSGTHLIVIHYTNETVGGYNADYYTKWEIWVDPNVSGGDLPASPDGTGAGIGLYYNGGGTAVANDAVWLSASWLAAGQSIDVDELYITTSASDFLVPEPTTLGLLGLGGLAILRRRRR